MAEYDMSRSTTNSASKTDWEVEAQPLEYAEGTKENFVDFPNATLYQGYYKSIPEFQSALDSLGIYVVGKGYEVSVVDKPILEGIKGRGNEVISSILLNHFVMSKVNGDSFLEIIRNDKGTLVNLKPIGAERLRGVKDGNGMLVRYEVRQAGGDFRKIKPENMFHKTNERIGDEDRGKPIVVTVSWVIDAIHEALTNARLVYNRNVFPLQIIEYDGEDTTKRDLLLAQYAAAISAGTALVVPKGVITITQADIRIQDPIAWIRYLENFFYQAVGVPKIILGGADEHTEAGGKVGYLTFEPTYVQEQTQLEGDLWNQMALKVKFNRPASLGGTIQQDEEKNMGQVGIQPNDMEASMTRE